MDDYFETIQNDDNAPMSPTSFTGVEKEPFNWQHTTTLKDDPFFEVQSPAIETSVTQFDAKKTKVSNGF